MTDNLPPLPEPVEVLDLWGNDCPVYNREQMRAYAIAYARAAVLAERERCANVCEGIEAAAWKSCKERYNYYDQGHSDGAGECAAAIRGVKT